MKRMIAVCALITLVGCAGTFTPGPVDPATGVPAPSPFEAGVDEAAKTYDESPWETFGPWGAAVAGLIAAAAGIRKGTEIYRKRKETPNG